VGMIVKILTATSTAVTAGVEAFMDFWTAVERGTPLLWLEEKAGGFGGDSWAGAGVVGLLKYLQPFVRHIP